MIQRDVTPVLKKLADEYPVITITGPRQSGKTTLARHAFGYLPYVSLENPDINDMAVNDPRGFLARYMDGAIFDEVQRAPRLLSYLQQIVDESKSMGRFVLTGSQQFGLLSSITQSLAGRVALVQLLPFSLRELYHGGGVPSIEEAMFQGLYPPVHDRRLDPSTWYANYTRTYIERDVRQLVNVRDLSAFGRFLRFCAGRSGQLLNLSGLASDCGISHATAAAWISVLEAGYIVYLLRPHFNNFSKRLVKTPKLYFHDTGLAAWLLNIRNVDQLAAHSMRGPLFETLVLGEHVKGRYNAGLEDNRFFWRDRSGMEVDLLLDEGDRLDPIEIKSGMTFNPEMTGTVLKFASLASDLAGKPVVVYGGDDSFEFKGVDIKSWKKYVIR
jgi:hypothetical protein